MDALYADYDDEYLGLHPDDYYDDPSVATIRIHPQQTGLDGIASTAAVQQRHQLLGPILDCTNPTAVQFRHLISAYLLANTLFAGITQLLSQPAGANVIHHFLAMLSGSVVLHYVCDGDGLLRIWFVVAGAMLLWTIGRRLRVAAFGAFMTGGCLTLMFGGELLASDARDWHRIRGPLLIVSMKAISVAFDVQDAPQLLGTGRETAWTGALAACPPNAWALGGYLLTPASCIFGPWICFGDYMAAYSMRMPWRTRFNCFAQVLVNIGTAFVCLIASNCLIEALLPGHIVWLGAYRDALAFRFSHYFVSYMGQSMLLLGGASHILLAGPLGGSAFFGLRTTQPLHVEFPRSLVRVVVVWNRSMHFWLRTYVFRVIRPYGIFAALLGTYGASALLHGLNLQVAAVLLSLGLFTYVEYNIRQHLASTFSACVLATACEPDRCAHRHKWNVGWVLLFNGLAGLLTVWHLAYLGLMFAPAADADGADLQTAGFSLGHTLARWSSLGFCSHWLVAALYLCYVFA